MSHPPAAVAWSVWGLGALLYMIAFYQRVTPAVITDKLMSDFAIGAAALGNLSAFYFYSYVAMQIPTGIIADRWGPRRLLTLGAGVATFGTALFALAPSVWWANAGRLLIGGSVAVAFVSMLKLATHWFAPGRFALASGMALLVGVVGAVAAGVPLRALVETFGWREVTAASALLTAALCVLIWLRVRDDPSEAGYDSHFVGEPADPACSQSIWKGLAKVLSYPNSWYLFFAPGGIAGAMLTFAGLWGVPFLTQVHGLSQKQAAAITSAMLIAWAAGGPLLGAASERLGRRKPLYAICAATAAAIWTAIVIAPELPLTVLVPMLVALGFVSGCIIIGFAFAKESVPLRYAGTSSGVTNMGTMTGGMLLQPAVGAMLDQYWQGATQGAVRLYDATAYRAGFALMLAWVVVSLVLVGLTRETRCRQLPS